MPQLSANLSMLFTELPFLERFAAAAKAGFKAVEFMFPYAFSAEAIAAELQKHQLQLVLHNLPAGDWDGGDRGIACDPARVEEFRTGVTQAIAYATALGVPRLNCLAGKAPAGVDAAVVRQTLVDNLRFAADALAKHNIRLLVEMINTFDIPGFYLHGTNQALALLDEVGSANLQLQYDVYHMQRMEGEIAATLQRQLPRIGHVQIADNPGRHEPGTGEINYAFLFRHLDAIGYQGWVGCEYKPAGKTEDGLHWLQALVR